MLKKLMNMKKKKGFTLIELIVVLVIMAILAAAAIPTMMGYVDEARASQHLAEGRSVYVAATAVLTEAYGLGRLEGTTPETSPIKVDYTSAAANTGVSAKKIYDMTVNGLGTTGDATITFTTGGRVESVVYNTVKGAGSGNGYTVTLTFTTDGKENTAVSKKN